MLMHIGAGMYGARIGDPKELEALDYASVHLVMGVIDLAMGGCGAAPRWLRRNVSKARPGGWAAVPGNAIGRLAARARRAARRQAIVLARLVRFFARLHGWEELGA
jgi:hypothetical protein